MLQLKQTFSSLLRHVRMAPKRYTIPSGIFIIGSIFYVAAFVIEKPVTFSYAEQTCVSRLTLFPEAHSTVDSSQYTTELSNQVKIGDWPIASRSICFLPTSAPQPGVTKVSVAINGSIIARQTFALSISTPVVADIAPLAKPMPVSKPLDLKLSGTDTIFSYALKVGKKQAECLPKTGTLSCDVEKLTLSQNTDYKAELLRQFEGQVVATVASKEIRTLSATTVTGSSIKRNETVYAKPTEINMKTDKKLVSVTAELYKREGKSRTKLASKTEVTGKGYLVKLAEQLPRSASYELVTEKLEATDGSGLVEPHKLAFKMSGGPKVTGVNANRTGVPVGSTVSITFDQSLSPTQNIDKYVKLGGGAKLIGAQANQLLISLAGVPKCSDFSIKLTNDLQSKYDIDGNSAWAFSGRTVCHTIGTIGYSSQGRPINAYYFGSGGTSVLYTGAIHGNEASTKYLMDRWIQDLEAKARDIPKSMSIVVVPIINPDGFAQGGRVNARNVDLNRNFDTSDWKKDITTVGNSPFPGGGGKSAMSEPETKAIASLAQRLRPKVILSYHSIGGLLASNQAGNANALASTYSRLSGYRNTTGQTGSTFEYSISGTADDWYAERLGVASILIELGSHSYHQFERNQAAMWAMINS